MKIAEEVARAILETAANKALPMKVGQGTAAVKVTNIEPGDRVVSWVSSNPSVVKVGKTNGKLKAQKKTGKAVITVTLASNKQIKFYVTVKKNQVKTRSVQVAEKNLVLSRKKTAKLEAKVLPLTSQDKLTYVSSNSKVASVNAKGIVKAKAKGVAKITVKSGSKKVVVKVTVK
ncbi:MAG: Ig-like domain-containing protein [Eubacteriales bacterium]|nr:Ig-like domain-containing protein [Eubacteriales bacterium]